MVQNNLTAEDVHEKAEELSFPSSVVDMMKGSLGYPPGGFPEPLRSKILRGEPTIDGRPGASMEPLDLQELNKRLSEEFGHLTHITEEDVMSAAMYPKVRLRDILKGLRGVQ